MTKRTKKQPEPIDEHEFNRLLKLVSLSKQQAKQLHRYILAPTEKPARQKRYRRYTDCGMWKARRLQCINAANGQCEICTSAKAIQAHHRTYARLGVERDADLLAVCKGCHEALHANEAGRKVIEQRVIDRRSNGHPEPLATIPKAAPNPTQGTPLKSAETKQKRKKRRRLRVMDEAEAMRIVERISRAPVRPKGMNRNEWAAQQAGISVKQWNKQQQDAKRKKKKPKFAPNYSPTGIPLRPDLHELNSR